MSHLPIQAEVSQLSQLTSLLLLFPLCSANSCSHSFCLLMPLELLPRPVSCCGAPGLVHFPQTLCFVLLLMLFCLLTFLFCFFVICSV